MILRKKINKFVVTKCQILRLKCIKFNLEWGSAPNPAGGAYSAPPDPLAEYKAQRNGERKGKGGDGRGGDGRSRDFELVTGLIGAIGIRIQYTINVAIRDAI